MADPANGKVRQGLPGCGDVGPGVRSRSIPGGTRKLDLPKSPPLAFPPPPSLSPAPVPPMSSFNPRRFVNPDTLSRVAAVDPRVGFLPCCAVADNRATAEHFAREVLEMGMLSVAVVWLGRREEVTLLRTGPRVDPSCRFGRFTRVRVSPRLLAPMRRAEAA